MSVIHRRDPRMCAICIAHCECVSWAFSVAAIFTVKHRRLRISRGATGTDKAVHAFCFHACLPRRKLLLFHQPKRSPTALRLINDLWHQLDRIKLDARTVANSSRCSATDCGFTLVGNLRPSCLLPGN